MLRRARKFLTIWRSGYPAEVFPIKLGPKAFGTLYPTLERTKGQVFLAELRLCLPAIPAVGLLCGACSHNRRTVGAGIIDDACAAYFAARDRDAEAGATALFALHERRHQDNLSDLGDVAS